MYYASPFELEQAEKQISDGRTITSWSLIAATVQSLRDEIEKVRREAEQSEASSDILLDAITRATDDIVALIDTPQAVIEKEALIPIIETLREDCSRDEVQYYDAT